MNQAYRDAFNRALQQVVKGGCQLRWEKHPVRCDGCFTLDKGKPVIFIDPSFTLEKTYSVFVHELCHARQRRDLWDRDGLSKAKPGAEMERQFEKQDALEKATDETAAEIMLRVTDYCDLSQYRNSKSVLDKLGVLSQLYKWQ